MAQNKTEKSWNFYELWHRYPKENNEEVYKKIGGKVEKNKPSFKDNLGAVKMSYALNRSNNLIIQQPNNQTVSGYTSDDEKKMNKKWFFYRKDDLESYIKSKNQHDEKIVLSKGEDVKQKLHGKTGIVFFEQSGKDGSTGTTTLWDGKDFIQPEHDQSETAEKTTLYVLK
jgi:hypothetical protein